MQYILFIVLLISIVIFYNIKKKEIEQKYIETHRLRLQQAAEGAIAGKQQEYEDLDLAVQEKQLKLNVVETQLQNIYNQYYEAQDQLETYREEQKQEIDSQLFELKQQKLSNIDYQVEQEFKIKQKIANEQHYTYLSALEKDKINAENEINKIKAEVDAFRAKQETINQEILRRRELEEKIDFYRVCLSDEAIMDITELQIVRQKLKKPEILDKIIYDTYVAKPVLEMVKRVLQNSTCSGIYKITCQKTKEVYIGKSTDVKSRWQQHCKTAFNCGTIASSLLHRKMQQYGIENFTFELLETVPKDKLSEREKFYIDFYKTKETGLNERSG